MRIASHLHLWSCTVLEWWLTSLLACVHVETGLYINVHFKQRDQLTSSQSLMNCRRRASTVPASPGKWQASCLGAALGSWVMFGFLLRLSAYILQISSFSLIGEFSTSPLWGWGVWDQNIKLFWVLDLFIVGKKKKQKMMWCVQVRGQVRVLETLVFRCWCSQDDSSVPQWQMYGEIGQIYYVHMNTNTYSFIECGLL